MSNCSKCGAELPDGANFCPACGKATAEKQRPQGKKSRGNGTGSVYKRGKTWCAAVSTGELTPGGHYVRRTKSGFATKKDAILYLDTLRVAPAANKKISALYEAIQPHIEKLSANKQTHYKKAYSRLQRIQNLNIGDLSIVDLQRTVDDAVDTYYPAKDMRDLLSLIYQQAIKEEYVSVNKARYIVLPDVEEKDTVPFTPEEIRALWADFQAGNTKTGFFLLMIYTGMMPGETRKVTADMVQLSEKRIVGAGLKTAKRRDTPIILPDIIVPVVEELLRGKTGRLWDADENSFYDYFAEMKVRTGCRPIKELRPYSCRHTTATTLADQNVSAAIIKEVMRHAKLTSTQRYMHIDQDTQADAMNAVFNAG